MTGDRGQPPFSEGALYPAKIMHRRHIAPHYRFVYRLFYLLLDVDRIDALAARLTLFSHNRFNLVGFHDCDHGDRTPGGLRPWAERLLRVHGVALDGGRIRLLALPRLFGFAFNPISLFYCEHADGSLRAVIAEVRNTFGERHSYVLSARGAPMSWRDAHEKDKRFHVSPFFDMVGRYRFQLAPPEESVRVHIREFREGVPILDASLCGERQPLTDARLLARVLAMPWATLKVVVAIHWEALKIWLRGARYVRKPAPPAVEAS